MTTFIVGCAVLVLLSGLFYLFPRRRSGGADEELERANIEWYRLRQTELAEEGADALQDGPAQEEEDGEDGEDDLGRLLAVVHEVVRIGRQLTT